MQTDYERFFLLSRRVRIHGQENALIRSVALEELKRLSQVTRNETLRLRIYETLRQFSRNAA